MISQCLMAGGSSPSAAAAAAFPNMSRTWGAPPSHSHPAQEWMARSEQLKDKTKEKLREVSLTSRMWSGSFPSLAALITAFRMPNGSKHSLVRDCTAKWEGDVS